MATFPVYLPHPAILAIGLIFWVALCWILAYFGDG